MMGDDDKVVQFRSAELPSRVKRPDDPKRRAGCQHKRTSIWMDEPILECSDCGAIIDPYCWIREQATKWDQIQGRVDYARKEADREMADIKKQLRQLRGEYADEKEHQATKKALMVLPPRKAAIHD